MSTAKIKVENPVTERSEIEAARAAPVSLPAGSFDASELQADLDKTAMAKNDKNREDLVAKAVEDRNKISSQSSGLPEGYVRAEVEDVDLGITEIRTVYDPKVAEAAAKDAPSDADTKGE